MKRFELPGTLDSLQPLAAYVLAAAAEAGLPQRKSYGLRLAIDELATNIVTHGYAENGLSGGIAIDGELTAEALTLVLEDTSPPFDPRTLLAPAASELAKPLDERAIGGLGIFLAFKAIDRFDYRHTGNINRNSLTMLRTPVANGNPTT